MATSREHHCAPTGALHCNQSRKHRGHTDFQVDDYSRGNCRGFYRRWGGRCLLPYGGSLLRRQLARVLRGDALTHTLEGLTPGLASCLTWPTLTSCQDHSLGEGNNAKTCTQLYLTLLEGPGVADPSSYASRRVRNQVGVSDPTRREETGQKYTRGDIVLCRHLQ